MTETMDYIKVLVSVIGGLVVVIWIIAKIRAVTETHESAIKEVKQDSKETKKDVKEQGLKINELEKVNIALEKDVKHISSEIDKSYRMQEKMLSKIDDLSKDISIKFAELESSIDRKVEKEVSAQLK